MPPSRTLPSPLIRPMKTERSHEENQERAYIAASRRSDRSLEARVESARRASEIHKRRTGRSLRVTEQDVINEEMYEEEDDDLPLQYRRLTAHLQTGSPDFNRRLHAYIQNQVAMRTALSQAVANQRFAASHGLQAPSAFPQDLFQTQDGFMQQQPQQQYPGKMPSPNDSNAYSPSYHPYAHHRSTSFATSNHSGLNTPVSGPKSDLRRGSEPVKSVEAPNVNEDSEKNPVPKREDDESGPGEDKAQAVSSPHTGISPLSTSIPPETQTFFQYPSFDVNQLSMPPFNFTSAEIGQPAMDAGATMKPSNMNPRYSGMSQTLAPSMLDTKNLSQNYMQPFSSGADSNDLDPALYSSTYESYNFDSHFSSDEFGLGQSEFNTDNEFSEFLDSSAFAEAGDEKAPTTS